MSSSLIFSINSGRKVISWQWTNVSKTESDYAMPPLVSISSCCPKQLIKTISIKVSLKNGSMLTTVKELDKDKLWNKIVSAWCFLFQYWRKILIFVFNPRYKHVFFIVNVKYKFKTVSIWHFSWPTWYNLCDNFVSWYFPFHTLWSLLPLVTGKFYFRFFNFSYMQKGTHSQIQ